MNSAQAKRGRVREPMTCNWSYPDELPVCQARSAILEAMARHQVLILCGATGSGKSTQLPKFCLEAGRGTQGLIAHTQPRRIAARALAERIAAEIGEEVGQSIGWQVRFKSVVSSLTRVKLMTDGVLLNELRRDRRLGRYDTLIVDEAHERSLNIDFLLGYLQGLARLRPDLKMIVTSATLDAEKFSAHFGGAPVIEVPGKSHPVALRYRPPGEDDLHEATIQAIREIRLEDDGDILIFLPGEREIREMAAALEEAPRLQGRDKALILPLYARLGSAHQQRIFQPGRQRRIILATNVAETSLTVPGIRHVIDTGTARISRYNPRSKVQNLLVENIAKANADQRRGRCGRTAPGICIRLYDEEEFASRPDFPEPEVQRTNLAAVLLQMADLNLGEPEDFPFIDPPHARYIRDARRLLEQLQALKPNGQLSKIGHKLARLPVDPRYGRILLAAQTLACEPSMIPVIAALSMQDPRERSFDTRQKASQAQAEFLDRSSDFLTLLTIWGSALEQKKQGSQAEFRRWCQDHFLNARRMREWQDLVRQIRSELHALNAKDRRKPPTQLQLNGEPPSEALHQALLYGLLDHIALHDADGEYRGPRNARWRIHPESAIGRRRPNWIVAAEIISTQRSHARVVAQVQPEWIERAAAHLLKREALEPYWNSKRGEVMARERVSLFGLVLLADRQVSYARFDPDHARQIFIEQALLGEQWGVASLPDFLRHNRNLIKHLREEENRQRIRGLIRPDEELIAWYENRLPPDVHSRSGLLKAIRDGFDASGLQQTEQDLRQQAGIDLDHAYPAELAIDGRSYPLKYVFDPGSEDDGITMEVPLASLNQLPQEPLDWLVPGLLGEKIEYLIKALPKAQRRRFVPVSQTVETCLFGLRAAEGDFHVQLARQLRQLAGAAAPQPPQLSQIPLPGRLQMRVAVKDENGKLIGADRDLESLRKRHAQTARDQFQQLRDRRWEARGLQRWNCPDLPEEIELKGGLRAFPCLRDAGQAVDLILMDDPDLGQKVHAQGVLKLLFLSQTRTLKARLKNLPDCQSTLLRLSSLPQATGETAKMLAGLQADPALNDDLLTALAGRALLELPLDCQLRTRAAFEQTERLSQARCGELLMRQWRAVQAIASAWADWQSCNAQLPPGVATQSMHDQICWLFAPGWLNRSPDLNDLSRYLQALCLRAKALPLDPARDSAREALIQPHWQRCLQALQSGAHGGRPLPASLRTYRWMIEEYRVSVFAQSIKTRQKVSPQRLDKTWLKVNQDLALKA